MPQKVNESNLARQMPMAFEGLLLLTSPKNSGEGLVVPNKDGVSVLQMSGLGGLMVLSWFFMPSVSKFKHFFVFIIFHRKLYLLFVCFNPLYPN